MSPCRVLQCNRPATVFGFCGKHYQELRHHGAVRGEPIHIRGVHGAYVVLALAVRDGRRTLLVRSLVWGSQVLVDASRLVRS